MVEQLFKHELKYYNTYEYFDFSELTEQERKQNNFLLENGDTCEVYNKFKKEIYIFKRKEIHSTEESFEKNYMNPLCQVSRTKYLIVVEKKDDKVALKFFTSHSHRKAGTYYFKKTTRVDYVSCNLKTGDFYFGYIQNYHKKRKFAKAVRKNSFTQKKLYTFKLLIKNYIIFFPDKEKVLHDAFKEFLNAIDGSKNVGLEADNRVYKHYLDKRGIKYPNNFHAFINVDFTSSVTLKELRKNDLRLVDTFMKKNGLNGKKIKKILHTLDSVNVAAYDSAKKTFGSEYVHSDEVFLKNLFEQPINMYFLTQPCLKDFLGVDEFKRAFLVYKSLICSDTFDSSTFGDHIRMLSQLRDYNEPAKWISYDRETYLQEHIQWTDILSKYRNGTYFRTYPKSISKYIPEEIISDGFKYYPVLLENSSEYNLESLIQSNCVKGYVNRSSSIIISLRKEDKEGKERATIEFLVSKDNIKRVQTLGRFNQRLTEEWDEPLKKLDEQFSKYIKSEDYEHVKVKKVCQNGKEIEFDSEFDENGYLNWNNNTDF